MKTGFGIERPAVLRRPRLRASLRRSEAGRAHRLEEGDRQPRPEEPARRVTGPAAPVMVPPVDLVLQRLGLTPAIAEHFAEARAAGMRLARVAAQHRGGHVLLSSGVQFGGEAGALVELRADLAGRLRRAIAEDSAAGPAVGDWVATTVAGERPSATIHAVLPRHTKLSRKAAGRGASCRRV